MTNKEIVLQIFTGGFNENEVTFDQIESKLTPLLNTLSISKVIMGWSLNSELYQNTKKLLDKFGVELYLWIPVFSETGLLKPVSLLHDFKGNEVKSYQLKAGENFEFYCPNQKINTDSFIQVYEEHFSNIDFDGIFLDKIRYGSFSNGLTGVFNCFCPECLKRYQEQGMDVNRIKEEMLHVVKGEKGYDKNPLNITGYWDGKYQFSDDIWDKFFDSKAKNVYDALEKISTYFREKGLKIGLDIFSPFIGYFVGQDIKRLEQIADFVKPMMYRMTAAPAGLPFEYSNFIKETTKGNIEDISIMFNKTLNSKGCINNTFDIDFVKAELDFITGLSIPTYCGIEINRIDEIAPVYPDYIKENLVNLEMTDINGYVLSWDLMSAPEDNIQEVIRYFKN